ncbi:MAG: DUF1836 domain-containing protein [Oscillospiraceae bacterium]|nr:DUF1836 domain-containing protein [Oscillospiraceae bacterium]
MRNEMKARIVAPVQEFRLPRYQEVPDVGLYLEQVTSYISNIVSPLQSITITGSMISNYVKKDLVSNPVKKRYSRDQIVALICIAVTKTVLTLEDIQVLLSMQRRLGDNRTVYDFFCQEMEDALNAVFGTGPDIEVLPPDVMDEKLLICKAVVAVAHKLYLDTYLRVLAESEQV